MNSFSIYQPISLSETSYSNPLIPVVTISPLPPLPGTPSNVTPPILVLPQSSQLMI
ncbi:MULTISPECIES: hypothetical protein [Cyanophyceae]|uniref:hypothetical protein n=1 Tax=Cyanophyceae TaxID=3028117 RepID=UPI00232C465F|nr:MULTISPECIES: hypothetical protein [Cyanophyceae]MDB9356429.1 hypothetical protein [Nodularia spumigena CS-587/03]MDB9306076.1 hypothetical protein [Nodularia spumigena CS-591/12]MDB9319635.1 hypothetical protein [Nodularia spumigena CS-590/01A]MDB9322138.1 hypothetical protein [Nodularia spumigena CS-591/07A]MDB9326986.1 hypothetical protein [Nodularia spumigena CS-590/02]